MNAKTRALLVALAVMVSAFGLDRALFDRTLFGLSNPSGWDSFRWYNFESLFRRVENKQRRRPLILVVGSSIAQYSTLPRLLEKELSDRYDVELISHAAMLPTDLVYYQKRLLRMKPAAVLWAVNPADTDLERTVAPWEAAPTRSIVAEQRFLRQRAPAKLYYPEAFLEERGLGADITAAYLFKAGMYSARFGRDEWFPFLLFRREWKEQLKSYLNYQGEPVAGGLFREGHTGACFAFPVSYLKDRNMWVELPPQLKLPEFRIRVVMRSSIPTLTRCRLDAADKTTDLAPERAGWQKIVIPEGGAFAEVHLTHVYAGDDVIPVTPGMPVYIGRGLRLTGNLGRRDIAQDEILLRRSNLEEARLESLPARDLLSDYTKRIQPEDWRAKPGMITLNNMRLGKILNAYMGFGMNRELLDMQAFVGEMSRATPVVIINQPENPLSLIDYVWSDWYAGYLKFLFSMKGPNVHVVDLHDRLTERDLGDPHHLTLRGAEKIQPEMARALKDVLAHER